MFAECDPRLADVDPDVTSFGRFRQIHHVILSAFLATRVGPAIFTLERFLTKVGKRLPYRYPV